MSNKLVGEVALNKLITLVKTLVATKQDTLTFDDTPTSGSTNPVKSGGIYSAIPRNTSDLNNDGNGTSNFATESYVNTNGGKIDKIKVNNVEQTITSKTVNITVPTNTSDLNNNSNFPVDANYVHTDNNFTTALKNKLDGIAAGAEVNVNADWNASSGDAQILNKPTVDSAPTSGHSSNLVSSGGVYTAIQNAISSATDLLWCEYDSTTYASITTAISNGKLPVVIHGEYTYIYIGTHTLTGHIFISSISALTSVNFLYVYCASDSSWSATNSIHVCNDDDVSNALSSYLPLSGGTMTGLLTLSGTPTANTHAATKKYVDDGLATKQGTLTFDDSPTASSSNPVKSGGIHTALGTKLDKSGGTMTGALTLSGAPTSNLHAATKKYVDDGLATKQDTLTFDDTPTSGSTNPVKSGGIYSAIPRNTSDLNNDSGFITSSDIPEGAAASTTSPKMDGTASVGTEMAFARGDHRHPTDTSRAPLASPALTGTPTAPTATAGTNTTQIATTAFVTSAIATAQTGAAMFQGTVSTTFAPTGYKQGYYWVVATAGTYAGEVCEPHDMIFAIANMSSAYSASDFAVVQNNLDIAEFTANEVESLWNSVTV